MTDWRRAYEMAAGPELDAIVAVQVLGMTYRPRFEGDTTGHFISQQCQYSTEELPGFSRDIAAAWLVVEHLRQQGWLITVKAMPDGFPFLLGDIDEGRKLHRRSVCSLDWMPRESVRDSRKYIWHSPMGHGESEPLAICRGALQALDEREDTWGIPVPAPRGATHEP